MKCLTPKNRNVFRDFKLLGDLLDNTIQGKNGCLEWKGALYVDGYGQKAIIRDSKHFNCRAHRLVWETLFGHTELHICHRCDNPKCINPSHLFAATRSENMMDMRKKGRACPSNKMARGEKVTLAKMTEKKVRQLRHLWSLGFEVRYLMKKFRLGSSAVRSIINGKTWKHVG